MPAEPWQTADDVRPAHNWTWCQKYEGQTFRLEVAPGDWRDAEVLAAETDDDPHYVVVTAQYDGGGDAQV